MILLKYNKTHYNRMIKYPTEEDIAEWESVNGSLDEIDSTYCPWRVFRFIDEDSATAFRMKFPKYENSNN